MSDKRIKITVTKYYTPDFKNYLDYATYGRPEDRGINTAEKAADYDFTALKNDSYDILDMLDEEDLDYRLEVVEGEGDQEVVIYTAVYKGEGDEEDQEDADASV